MKSVKREKGLGFIWNCRLREELQFNNEVNWLEQALYAQGLNGLTDNKLLFLLFILMLSPENLFHCRTCVPNVRYLYNFSSENKATQNMVDHSLFVFVKSSLFRAQSHICDLRFSTRINHLDEIEETWRKATGKDPSLGWKNVHSMPPIQRTSALISVIYLFHLIRETGVGAESVHGRGFRW